MDDRTLTTIQPKLKHRPSLAARVEAALLNVLCLMPPNHPARRGLLLARRALVAERLRQHRSEGGASR